MPTKRYHQLYAEYIRECAANPNRNRYLTATCGPADWVPGTTMTQGDYLRYKAQGAQPTAENQFVFSDTMTKEQLDTMVSKARQAGITVTLPKKNA